MTVLDTSAIIGLLRDQPCAAQVAEMIAHPDDGIATLPAVGIVEIMDVLVRRERRRVAACDEALELLVAGGLDIAVLDGETARLAGLLRARHWSPDRRPISLADSTILATAILREEPLATTDLALAAAARAEGHPVIALPDSAGRTPA